MEGVLVINYEESDMESANDIMHSINHLGMYELNICPPKGEKIEVFIKSEELIKDLKTLKLLNAENEHFFEEDEKLYDDAISGKLNFEKTISKVLINLELKDIVKFITENDFVQNKDIILPDSYELNHSELEKIKYYFPNNPNVYLNVIGNTVPVSINDYEQTINYIDNIVNKISEHNLTPFEEALYAYDIIRDRVYKKEKLTELGHKSRDLTNVILGDKIVCVGFTEIYKAVLTKLGIKNKNVVLRNKDNFSPGHVRNSAFIQDKKYNINGLYFMDVTFDSKSSEDNDDFLYTYKHFAKTKQWFDEKCPQYRDETYNDFSEDTSIELKNIIDKQGVQKIPGEMLRNIAMMGRFIDDEELLDPNMNSFMCLELGIKPKVDFKEKYILETLERYGDLISSEIPAEKYLDALRVVREIEYAENPEKYHYDVNVLFSITLNSTWYFTNDNESRFFRIMGEKKLNKPSVNRCMLEYISDNDLERKIALTKKLIKILE